MVNNIENAIDAIRKAQNILVLTGAGISTNSGIPDFRGEKGLYNIVKKYGNLPYPEAIFDIEYFRINPKPFFNLSKDLFYSDSHPSICHDFLAWLEEKGKIKLIVTQNIDMLHTIAGSKNVLECHGTYTTAHCQKCGRKYSSEEYSPAIMENKIPRCSCGGIIKPDVVFFGENLPDSFYNLYYDRPKFDLVIVMGSSLTVNPAASVVMSFTDKIPSMIINLEATHYDNQIDYVIHKDLDEFAKIAWKNLKETE